MGIPESQLDTWSHQGSITQSSTTYATIKSALETKNTAYSGKSYEVFLQGSYGNDTNIYAESDVDIVIRLDAIYYYDTSALTPEDLATFSANFTPGTYPYADYKSDVVAALQKRFGSDVKPGTKSIKIKANGSRRSADVIVATEFRRYYSAPFGLGPQFTPGICFFTSGGQRIVNFPKQHSQNSTAKHQATGMWFKPMVRIMKNMRSKLVETGSIEPGSAPSYFLEGLLYNVPNDKFGKKYTTTFVEAMNWIRQADKNALVCANGQYYLRRDDAAECWPCAACDGFINSAVKLWNNWR